MAVNYLMQARDSVTGDLYHWIAAINPDWAGSSYPGPNSAEDIAIVGANGAAGDPSPLTTKGDLYTYDADDARLPVGADGLALLAASGEATGLGWGQVDTAGIADGAITNAKVDAAAAIVATKLADLDAGTIAFSPLAYSETAGTVAGHLEGIDDYLSGLDIYLTSVLGLEEILTVDPDAGSVVGYQADGSAAAPGWGFSGANTTGTFRATFDRYGIAHSGVQAAIIGTDTAQFTGPVSVTNGGVPALALGEFRAQFAAAVLAARNNAGDGDLNLVGVNASDQVTIGDVSGGGTTITDVLIDFNSDFDIANNGTDVIGHAAASGVYVAPSDKATWTFGVGGRDAGAIAYADAGYLIHVDGNPDTVLTIPIPADNWHGAFTLAGFAKDNGGSLYTIYGGTVYVSRASGTASADATNVIQDGGLGDITFVDASGDIAVQVGTVGAGWVSSISVVGVLQYVEPSGG